MNKHLKHFPSLMMLMVLASISVFALPLNAEAAQSLVENSWRYEDGQLVAEGDSSEEDEIALLSMTPFPMGLQRRALTSASTKDVLTGMPLRLLV